MTTPCPAPSRTTGRRLAGQDPAKRDQILAGAEKIFLEKSFASASVQDICQAAGVSKGTLYVYFADKEHLFVALVERHRDRVFQGIVDILRKPAPLADRLVEFGETLSAVLCSDKVISAQRVIIGTVEEMPALGREFYECGAQRVREKLADCLRAEAAAGRLDLPDADLAAYQFMSLTGAGLWRPRLFGKLPDAPDAGQIAVTVASAVRMFLRAYAAPAQDGA